MKLKNYTVQIEQPCLRTYKVEARDEEHALEVASTLYNTTKQVFREEDFGTDAQAQVLDEAGDEALTDWIGL